MNIFRFLGDFSHFVAIIILLLKIWKTRSCAAYNSVAKVLFILSSYATLFFIYYKFKATYDSNHDTFKLRYLLIPCAILSLLVNHGLSFMEVFWAFSIYLEAVAIMPQLFLISKTGEAESITTHYLFALGSYRGLYILNWAYRYYFENHFEPIAVVAGVIQTILYLDFFYLYISRGLGRRKQLLVRRGECSRLTSVDCTVSSGPHYIKNS